MTILHLPNKELPVPILIRRQRDEHLLLILETVRLLLLSVLSQNAGKTTVPNEGIAGEEIRALNATEGNGIDMIRDHPIEEDLEVATIDRESVTDPLTDIGGVAPEEETTITIDVS